jgi:putative MATE family efflux protein
MTQPSADLPVPLSLAPEEGAAGPQVVPSLPESLDRSRPMTWRVVALAWPAWGQQFLILLVGLSDRYLAGNLEVADPENLSAYQAAQTTGNYLAWFISSYTVLVSVGATALVAHCVGAGDWKTAVRATHQSVLLALAAGLTATVLGLTGLGPMVAMLGLHGPAAVYAAQYLAPMFALLTFQVLEAAGIACLVGAGDTVTGLWVRAGVTTLNVPLAWTLCHGIGPWPGLGFVGIALGTALCHLLGGTAALAVLAHGRAGLRLRMAGLVPDPGLLWRLLRVSVPAAADSLSVVAGQFWFLHIVNGLGDTAAAAHGIALGWEALGYQSGHAFGVAAMALVGQNLGAKLPAEATRGGWTAFALGCGVMTLMAALFFTLAHPMFLLFCPRPEQAPVVEVGVPVLRLVAFAMPALASTIVFTAALRGAGDTRVPVLFTWVGFLAVRIPLAYLLTAPALGLGLFGAWLAMAADLWVRGAFFLARFAGGRWKRARV